MLGQGRRRWPNNNPTSGQHIVPDTQSQRQQHCEIDCIIISSQRGRIPHVWFPGNRDLEVTFYPHLPVEYRAKISVNNLTWQRWPRFICSGLDYQVRYLLAETRPDLGYQCCFLGYETGKWRRFNKYGVAFLRSWFFSARYLRPLDSDTQNLVG